MLRSASISRNIAWTAMDGGASGSKPRSRIRAGRHAVMLARAFVAMAAGAARAEVASALREVQERYDLDHAALTRVVEDALVEVTASPRRQQTRQTSMGVVVRKGLVVPERDLHHLCWVLCSQQKVGASTEAMAERVLGFLAVPQLGQPVNAAGGCHTCAVKASGELVCFGRDDEGQCRVPADLGPVIAVAAAVARP